MRSSLSCLDQLSEVQADDPYFPPGPQTLADHFRASNPCYQPIHTGHTVANLFVTRHLCTGLEWSQFEACCLCVCLCVEFSCPGKRYLSQIYISTRYQAGTQHLAHSMKGVCLIFPYYKAENASLEKRSLSAVLSNSDTLRGLTNREQLVHDFSCGLKRLLSFAQGFTV